MYQSETPNLSARPEAGTSTYGERLLETSTVCEVALWSSQGPLLFFPDTVLAVLCRGEGSGFCEELRKAGVITQEQATTCCSVHFQYAQIKNVGCSLSLSLYRMAAASFTVS